MTEMGVKTLGRLWRLQGHLSASTGIWGKGTTGVRWTSAGAAGSITEAAKEVLATRRTMPVLDSKISFLDTGIVNDHVVLFLHGNPTAAFLWRDVIPHVKGIARCLAPDLIGMGHSGKEPNNSYKFFDHYKYLSAWIEGMDLPKGKNINLVVHDWGSGLGFHWANNHKDRVQSITYMEAVVGPIPHWSQFPAVSRNVFKALRSPAGDEMVLQKNFFVEKLLPMAILRKLSEEEMEEYRRPYKEPGESRRPTLTWPRQIPIENDPPDVYKAATEWNTWLATDQSLPKLHIDSDPGFFAPGIRKAVKDWPNQRTVKAKGSHFVQEDSPDVIGEAVAQFLVNDVFKK